MHNVIDFAKPIVKEELTFFEQGAVVACREGSPLMVVMSDSGETVEVLYPDPLRPGEFLIAYFPVNTMYQVVAPAKFDGAKWSTKNE